MTIAQAPTAGVPSPYVEATPGSGPALAPSASAPGASVADDRRWKALGVIALVQFMLVLDVTVVNVALPHIQADLGFSRAGLAWVVDGYVLTAGGLLLLGGRLADLLGRRRMFIVGVLLFAGASALSGASSDPGMLVASRFVQGMGEAVRLRPPSVWWLCFSQSPMSEQRPSVFSVALRASAGHSGPSSPAC